LELTPWDADADERYKKIVAKPAGMDRLLVDCFLDAYPSPPESIWIDLDATDDPLHGSQEGRFFHGDSGHYCYLSLYIFCGEHLLCARLRESNIDAAAGSVEELTRIVAQIRARWPQVEIVIRGDSGFCRGDIMAWVTRPRGCTSSSGWRRTSLIKRIGDALHSAERAYHLSGQASRVFEDFSYHTVKSWSQARRVAALRRAPVQGRQPALRGHLPARRALWRPHPL